MAGNDTFTKILLHFDGTNGSTTISDSNIGGSAHTWTASGNAQIGTAASKFGGASLLCDGTGDYVSTADSADFTLGSGDWTIDCWFNWAGGSGVRGFLAGQCASDGSNATTSFIIEHTTANLMKATVGVGSGGPAISGTTTITTAGWHHIALVASGGNAKLFIDGVQEGSTTSIGGTPNNVSNALAVGRGGEITTTSWNGSIDEFRLSVGIARWTSNFTPPTSAYTAVYTLACTAASFALSAVAVSLRRYLRLNPAPASFALTGVETTVRRVYRIMAASASFVLTATPLISAFFQAVLNIRKKQPALQSLRRNPPEKHSLSSAIPATINLLGGTYSVTIDNLAFESVGSANAGPYLALVQSGTTVVATFTESGTQSLQLPGGSYQFTAHAGATTFTGTIITDQTAPPIYGRTPQLSQ